MNMQRESLLHEKRDIELQIAELQIPKRKRVIVESNIADFKTDLLKRLRKVNHELLNHPKKTIPSDGDRIFRDVVYDSLGEDYYKKVVIEVQNREKERPENIVKYTTPNETENILLKNRIKTLEDVISNSRKELSKYIDAHDRELSRVDFIAFLKSISSLNTTLQK